MCQLETVPTTRVNGCPWNIEPITRIPSLSLEILAITPITRNSSYYPYHESLVSLTVILINDNFY